MTIRSIFIVAAAALLFSGCAPKFESLTAEQKRDFYERVIEEAAAHRERAEFFEGLGLLEKAMAEYDRAAFYGDIGGVDSARVTALQTRIDTQRESAYGRAKRAERGKKFKSALAEYSAVLRADSRFSDAPQEYEALLKNPEVAAFIKERSDRFEAMLKTPSPTVKQKNETDKAAKELLIYRHDHPAALGYLVQNYETLRQEKSAGLAHIRSGRQALAQNDLEGAEAAFKRAQTFGATQKEAARGLAGVQKRKDAIYLTSLARKSLAANQASKAEEQLKKALAADSGYEPAKSMLGEIRKERAHAQSGQKLSRGRELLTEGRYLEALDEAESILEADPKHAGAMALKADAQKAIKTNIPRLLKEGEQLFDQNRFDESIQRFESVLVVDPDNNVSQTYLKRISNRLETLQMLGR
ncbi:MAG: hypothetical protein AB7E49_03345 [Campylobacterales bacterium]